MKNIILIAPPAAGKGTEAQILKERYKIPHISTGDLLRDEVSKETKIGLEIKEQMETGQLVDDDTVFQILRGRIIEKDCENGYILDGFPRTVLQAITYDNMLKDLKK